MRFNVALTIIFTSAVFAFIHLHRNFGALLGWSIALTGAFIRTCLLYKAKPLPDGIWVDDPHRKAWLSELALSASWELFFALLCFAIGIGCLGVSVSWLVEGIIHKDGPTVESHWPSGISMFTASRTWGMMGLDWIRSRRKHVNHNIQDPDEQSPLIP
jgi:hypothetical protein